MIVGKIRKWGNSLGVIIPKEEVEKLELEEGNEIAMEIERKGNPLRELFGFGSDDHITKRELQESRRELESKWS